MNEERLEGIMNDLIVSFKTAENAACDLIEIMGRTIGAVTAAYEIKCELIRERMKEAANAN